MTHQRMLRIATRRSPTQAKHTCSTDAWYMVSSEATEKLTAKITANPIIFLNVMLWSSGMTMPLSRSTREIGIKKQDKIKDRKYRKCNF